MVMEKSQFMNSCWQNTGPNKNTINLVMPCSFFGKKNHGNIIIIETIYLIWKDSHSHSAKYYLSKIDVFS